MKKTKRIFCALLATLIILPMAFVGANANTPTSTPATPAGTVLFAEDYSGYITKGTALTADQYAVLGLRDCEAGNYPSVGKNVVTLVDSPVAGEGTALQFKGNDGSYTATEFFSADKMQAANEAEAFTSYVLQADMTLRNYGGWWYGFMLAYDDGTAEDATVANGVTPDFAAFTWRGGSNCCLQTWGTAATGSGYNGSIGALVNETHTWTLEVDMTTGVAIGYVDGVQAVTITSAQFATYGAFAFTGYNGSTADIDNLSITRGTIANPGTVIYENDFDSYLNIPVDKTLKDVTISSEAYVEKIEGNNELFINSKLDPDSTKTWGDHYGLELVPKTVFEGQDKYTISFDIAVEYKIDVEILLNFRDDTVDAGDSRAAAKLYWVGNTFYYGEYTDRTNPYVAMAYNLGDNMSVQIEVDGDNATLFVNGNEYALTSAGVDPTPGAHGDTVAAPNGGAFEVYVGLNQAVHIDNLTVTTGLREDAPATMVGVQETEVVEDTYNVRFLATLGNQFDYTDYKSVGFEIVCPYIEGKEWDVTCTTLYSSVTAGDNVGELTTVTAESCGGKYIMAFTVKNIPVSAGEVTFWAVPYFETDAGVAVGTPYEIVYNAGEFVSSSVYAAGTVYNWNN